MEPTTPPAAEPQKKTLFETVVVSTPVLLTVVATFILGRSSSEMTQAQYQRAVASQNQSKVGDQWAFFQAKRIRGTTYEATAISLVAQRAGPFTADTLTDAAQELQREILLTKKDTDKLNPQLDALADKAQSALESANAAVAGKGGSLKPETVKAAFDALELYPSARSEKSNAAADIEAEQQKLLEEILTDIRKFKSEKELARRTLASLTPDTIDKAIDNAKKNAAAVAERGKAIDRVLEEFDGLVNQQMVLAREYQRVLGGYLSAQARANGNSEDMQKLQSRLDRVRTLSAKLLAEYKAARFAFDAKRYEDDARSNQEIAYRYDVQVLYSSARSDKHLARSFGFMIAMLVAQVGVTVGSLAMMLKYRMPVWAMAALAGIVAIAFGVCVYLEVAPL